MRFNDDNALLTLRDQIATARLEDVPALMAQMEQVAAVASSRSKGPVEPINPSSPYFGRLRLNERGKGVRDVLIGKTTYIEPREGIRIVDWRHAPVSQLYYRYDEGAAFEEVFGEREVEGEILLRRTLAIVDGKLQRVDAPQGVFVRSRRDGNWRRFDARRAELAGGEGSAVRAEHIRGVLGVGDGVEQREDRHLQDVTALLDPRQFELISRPETGLVIIQGGAGSGKTTIGVHRMSFLAFQSKARFTPDRMLVIVGTPALADYIGQLLEALGMAGVRVVTFSSWARKTFEHHFPRHARVATEDGTPIEVSRLKTDPRLIGALAKGAAALRRAGRVEGRDAMELWAETLTDGAALRRLFARSGPAGEREGRLGPQQLERALAWCAERCPAVLDYGVDREEDEPDIEGADGVVEQLDERALLDAEDYPLLLRAYQLVCGPLRSKKNKALRFEHLFVDEAQDLAPLDFCVLADIVSDAKSITLAGDTSQRLYVDTGFERWEEVTRALDLSHVAIEPLRIAYRSTREVLQLARAVLGPLADPDEPVATRSGAPVEHHNLPSQGAAAAFIASALRPLAAREPRATIAILTRYAEQADAYFDALEMAEVPYLRRVKDYDFSFRPGVEVTEIRQVKGLEYDYVILVDVNADTYPVNDESRYQLHIGATRAAHQLWIISTATPSPLLPEWLEP
jgi:DNA helicase-2/ATP-dependent DNA helicase PcrA